MERISFNDMVNHIYNNDNESFVFESNNIISLTDFINNGYFHTVLTDDARDFNIHKWQKRVEKDDDSGSANLHEQAFPTKHFTVSKEDVQNVLNKIATSDLFVADYYKTKGFMKAHGFSTDDIKQIAKQLSVSDYSYSMVSNSFKPGDVISVFITNKDFEVNGQNLSGCILYIEIDADYGDPVAIVSMHSEFSDSKRYKNNPYKDEQAVSTKDNDKENIVNKGDDEQ